MADPDTWSLPEEIVPKVGWQAKTEQDAPDAPRPSLTELDPSLLRGVNLSAGLSGWGKHFAHQAPSSMYEVQERDWNPSFMVQNLHHFLSHDWKTSRSAKTLSLMFIFNTRGAFLATLPFCILIGLWSGPVRPPVLSHAQWTPDLHDLLAYPIFLFFFCFWQRLRSLVKHPVVVFLDKLCIAQHDSQRKAKGILGLASFLDKSANLTILWSPRYFSRLWCCYEIATFLREADAADAEAKSRAKSVKSVVFFPVAFSWIAVLWAINFALTVVGLRAIFVMAPDMSTSCLECDALGLLVFGADFVLNAVVVYAGLDLFSSVHGLDRQLRGFNIKEADCFCCGHNHQHPETGETLMCDRVFVYQAVKQWYVRYEDDDDDDALEKFNQVVRTQLRSKVLESVSKTSGVLLPQTLVIYLPCFILLPLVSDSVALMRQGILWMPGSSGPMHSLWRCIAIFSALYTLIVLVTMSFFWIFWLIVRQAFKLTKCKGSKVCLSIVLGPTLTFLFGSINALLDALLVGMEAEDLVDFVPFINFPLLLLNFYLYNANSCTCRRR